MKDMIPSKSSSHNEFNGTFESVVKKIVVVGEGGNSSFGAIMMFIGCN